MGALKVVLGFLGCVVVPGILQGTGFFMDDYGSTSNPNCTHIGFKNNGCQSEYEAAYVLQLFPTYVLIIPAITIILTIAICTESAMSCMEEGGCSLVWCMGCMSLVHLWIMTIFCIIFFPFAGIMIIAGCIILRTEVQDSALGDSFPICMTAGLWHILGMAYLLYNNIKKLSEKSSSAVATQPIQTVSGQVMYTQETTTTEVHQDSGGNVWYTQKYSLIRFLR